MNNYLLHFEFCGLSNGNIVLLQHTNSQTPEGLAGFARSGVNFFVDGATFDINLPKPCILTVFNSVSSTDIEGDTAVESGAG